MNCNYCSLIKLGNLLLSLSLILYFPLIEALCLYIFSLQNAVYQSLQVREVKPLITSLHVFMIFKKCVHMLCVSVNIVFDITASY